jgi:hypothetical protein
MVKISLFVIPLTIIALLTVSKVVLGLNIQMILLENVLSLVGILFVEYLIFTALIDKNLLRVDEASIVNTTLDIMKGIRKNVDVSECAQVQFAGSMYYNIHKNYVADKSRQENTKNLITDISKSAQQLQKDVLKQQQQQQQQEQPVKQQS